MGMTRVSKTNPCDICGKPDWCLRGTSVVICMRTLSTRTKQFSDGSVGYIHPAKGSTIRPEPVRYKPEPVANLYGVLKQWLKSTNQEWLEEFAKTIAVTPDSLREIGCARRDPNTWAFPMRDDKLNLVGIRLRTLDGKKFAVTGSHQGLFIPSHGWLNHKTVYLVEGPTDTAAALSIGAFAIGRPSCNGAIYLTRDAVQRMGFQRAVIVADADNDIVRDDKTTFNPGFDGATLLSQHIGIPNCTLVLPCKDMREFVRLGGTDVLLESLTKSLIWRK